MKHFSSSKTILLAGMLLLGSKAALAQFTLSAEVRPRAEFRNGFKTVKADGEKPAFFVEQRSRLNTDFRSDKLHLRLTVQDVRIWGNTNQVYKSDPSLFNVYEAYGEYNFTPKLSIRAGRQELNYDNARFLGNLDWAQQGRSHDAVRLLYADSSGFTFHAGAGFNQNVASEPTKLFDTYYSGVDNYKTMQYLWLHKEGSKGELSFLFFNDGRQKPDSAVAFRQTYGLVGNTKGRAIQVGGELYYQGGKDATGKKVSALLAAASITFKTKVTPVTVGVDFLSGTSRGSSKNKSFNPLYGTNHAFYGFMDYFYVGNNHSQEGRTTGLIDTYVKTNFKLGQTNSLLLALHHFESPVRVYDPAEVNKPLSSRLGEEIDLVYNQNFSPDFNMKVGYSQLLANQSLEVLKGKNGNGLNQWAWVMLTFKPVLFKH